MKLIGLSQTHIIIIIIKNLNNNGFYLIFSFIFFVHFQINHT